MTDLLAVQAVCCEPVSGGICLNSRESTGKLIDSGPLNAKQWRNFHELLVP